ncbi:hypothetical protein TL16_g02958 [Triparma laevis f. inornata]|uniref:Kinesin light chain n=1 Tax=Triparma laevis f. inornata TaxID=1714386 RepID=A0A9W6ZX65_9STRA|nr:hypothetical protein TL16_g02958 [Triparma laevis f. inornata]
MSDGEAIETFRDLLKRMERALGENIVTLMTLKTLACMLHTNGEFGKAIKIYEKCLAGRTKVLGEDHRQTLDTLNNLGAALNMANVYVKGFHDHGKASELYERSLEGLEAHLGKNQERTKKRAFNFSTLLRISKSEERLESLEKAHQWLCDDEAIRLFKESLS